MNTKLKFTIVLSIAILMSNCSDENLSNSENQNGSVAKSISYENIPFDAKGKIMEKFGIGISAALKVKEFRELIKTESLKRFNKDTDVLYNLIKDKPFNGGDEYLRILNKNSKVSNSPTLHDFLIPFFESEQELNNFESQLPLLTIFVPELPENSFSAEIWDVNNPEQIPDVALRLDNITYTPVIGRDDDNYLIAPEDVPSWSIVVLKDNERLITNTDPLFASTQTRIIKGEEGVEYKFSDNNFDPLVNSNKTTSGSKIASGFQGANDNFIPQYLKTGYDVFSNDPTGWQRDNIYYGLTPTNTSGAISGGKYREYITTFKVNGSTPQAAYGSISDSYNEIRKDPSLLDWQRTSNTSGWTDGNFEFIVQLSYGAKSSNLGAALRKEFSATPNDLFTITWDRRTTGIWFWRKTWYRPRITGLKTMNTAVPNGVRLEFSVWDLNNFANHFLYSFEEKDANTTTTNSETKSSKFNANFSLEPSTGLLKKIGLKFGASYETSQSNTFTVVITTGNDKMGDVELNFYDNAVNKVNGVYYLRRYTSNNVEVSIAPLQVQF
jgi:hypothetical protein